LDAGAVIALLSAVLAIVLSIAGGVIKYLLGRLSVAESLDDARQETIAELRRQKERLEVTALIQDRFFSQLPRTLDPGPPRQQRGDQ
jgi:membrane protein YqaA with SNARE-associated domain